MQLFGVLIPEKEQLVATAVNVAKGKAGLSLYAALFGLAIGSDRQTKQCCVQ